MSFDSIFLAGIPTLAFRRSLFSDILGLPLLLHRRPCLFLPSSLSFVGAVRFVGGIGLLPFVGVVGFVGAVGFFLNLCPASGSRWIILRACCWSVSSGPQDSGQSGYMHSGEW